MEESPPIRKIVRMNQIYAVGGTFEDPSDFANVVNKNLIILHESDKNCIIKDIKFNVFTDQRFNNSAPIYLAFIIAEIDMDLTPEPEVSKKKSKKEKKKKKRK